MLPSPGAPLRPAVAEDTLGALQNACATMQHHAGLMPASRDRPPPSRLTVLELHSLQFALMQGAVGEYQSAAALPGARVPHPFTDLLLQYGECLLTAAVDVCTAAQATLEGRGYVPSDAEGSPAEHLPEAVEATAVGLLLPHFCRCLLALRAVDVATALFNALVDLSSRLDALCAVFPSTTAAANRFSTDEALSQNELVRPPPPTRACVCVCAVWGAVCLAAPVHCVSPPPTAVALG